MVLRGQQEPGQGEVMPPLKLRRGCRLPNLHTAERPVTSRLSLVDRAQLEREGGRVWNLGRPVQRTTEAPLELAALRGADQHLGAGEAGAEVGQPGEVAAVPV